MLDQQLKILSQRFKLLIKNKNRSTFGNIVSTFGKYRVKISDMLIKSKILDQHKYNIQNIGSTFLKIKIA